MLAALALLAATAGDPPSFHGFLSERLTLTHPRADAPLSTAGLDVVEALTEANLQGRARLLDERLLVAVDASAYLSLGAVHADYDEDVDALVGVGDPSRVDARPFVVFSEAFASLEPLDHLVLTAGKRRVVWGPGFAASATDVLMPPRDPTEPSSQREGALLVAVDAPFPTFTLTAMFLPKVLDEVAGLPRVLYVDELRDELRYAAVLRGYALVLDADVNAWVVHSNLWDDDRQDQLRAMATFARTIFGAHGVHLEGQLKRGSGRRYANDECLPEDLDLLACMRGGTPILEQKRADEDRVHLELLAGWRFMFDDDAVLSAEWLYQSDGLGAEEFEDLVLLQRKVGALQRAGLRGPALGGERGGGTPLKLAPTFLRRHHVFASWTKPRIADDFALGATWIVAPEDGTSIAAAQGQWSAREWLTLSLSAYAPLPSPLRALDEDFVGEADLAPFSARVVAEARVWF